MIHEAIRNYTNSFRAASCDFVDRLLTESNGVLNEEQ
jgi:hypothetical protein